MIGSAGHGDLAQPPLSGPRIQRYIETLPKDQSGWLAALRDLYVSRAMALMHAGLQARDRYAAGHLAASAAVGRTARSRPPVGCRGPAPAGSAVAARAGGAAGGRRAEHDRGGCRPKFGAGGVVVEPRQLRVRDLDKARQVFRANAMAAEKPDNERRHPLKAVAPMRVVPAARPGQAFGPQRDLGSMWPSRARRPVAKPAMDGSPPDRARGIEQASSGQAKQPVNRRRCDLTLVKDGAPHSGHRLRMQARSSRRCAH